VPAETLGGQDVVLTATASFLALCGETVADGADPAAFVAWFGEMLADGAESGCIRGLVRRDGG
jgi:hypothetical protein